MATDTKRSSFGVVTAFPQRFFDALDQPLPKGRDTRPDEEEEGADDGLSRCSVPTLNNFTTRPGAQAWMSADSPWPTFSPRDPRIARPPLGEERTSGGGQRQTR
jgi:hypothetical protein